MSLQKHFSASDFDYQMWKRSSKLGVRVVLKTELLCSPSLPNRLLQMWLITYRFGHLVNGSDSNPRALITLNYTEEGTAQRFN